ncbi:tRNA1(Val) (adenine(37)-N6)-methyltransferase [Desulfohalovibrio reitneri]|uniref:tRNA1(Val) (adenine(37)-N6)-methyltransferase n=1 Tax=Desulfohalovibrio reitneri TaxID=1307759 RepID=UPI0004A77576|nr:methyltransferase [Desulfohalovibrio reitneri]
MAGPEEARAAFPRGLNQPEGGFRFGADALLLASLADPCLATIDLGAGCGAAGLGLALRGAPRVGLLDRDPDMAACARRNADLLGLAGRTSVYESDVREVRGHPDLAPESWSQAICNPPYRRPGSGREAAPARQGARFAEEGSLDDFCRAAAYLLANRAPLCAVFLAERLVDLFAALRAARLEPKLVRPVQGRRGGPVRLVLVRALKNGRPGLELAPQLTLYDAAGAVTAEALDFCPWLAANPRRAGNG